MSLNTSPFDPVEELLHGIHVRDPYRWLEDRSLPATNEWIEVQQKRCQAYFTSCDTLDVLRRRVHDLLNVEVVDQPAKVRGHYFYRRWNRDQEQACIYVQDARTGRERLLVDPSCQGPFTSVGIHRISDDSSQLAYEVKRGGADTKEIHIVDVGSGRVLPDGIGSGYARGFAFTSASDGFYYCHEAPTGVRDHLIQFQSLLGTGSNRMVFGRPRSLRSRLVLIADTFHLGAMWIRKHGTESVCDFFLASRERDNDWQPVFVNKRLPYSPFLYGGRIFVLSYEGAPNGEIIELNSDGQRIHTIVPEAGGPTCQIVIAGERLFICDLKNNGPAIHSWTLEGRFTGEVEVPVDGTVQLLPQLGHSCDSFFYTYESFTQPVQIYEYATELDNTSPFYHRARPIELNGLEIRKFSFPGKDGTPIPITLVARIPVLQSPTQPVIMTGYGGFGVAMTPQYSVLVTIMMELNTVFALPHIRGGGELGKPWHDAGRARNRQTAIGDFVAAGEWLCRKGITVPSKLAIFGGSNSGLLVGSAMTQSPGLFRAVLCIAPLLDMVRYERFDQAAKWQSEYGSVECAEEFQALHALSPYHHVRSDEDYPATLFVTGDRDDRCNPAHVRKMAARLQERAAQRNSILVDYSAERGHSPVLPLSERVDALARRLAFLCRELTIAPEEGRHETVAS